MNSRALVIGLLISFTLATTYSFYQSNFDPSFSQMPQQSAATDAQPTIIIDLGGVLVDVNPISFFWQLGPLTVLSYAMRSKKPLEAIADRFYELLDQIEKGNDSALACYDYQGRKLPYLFCQWLRGAISSDALLDRVNEFIANTPHFFDNRQEATMIHSFATILLTPQLFIKTVKKSKKAVNFLTQCKQEGYRLVLLSNWDPESFPLLQEKYPELFCLFDEIIISGYENQLKPSPEIFTKAMGRSNPSHTVFIDDQEENRRAAQKLGIQTITCNKNSTCSLESKEGMFTLLAHLDCQNPMLATDRRVSF